MNRSTYYPYWKYNNYRQDANERLAVHIALRNHHYSTAWDPGTEPGEMFEEPGFSH